jgi:hypothetical protein
LASLKRHPMADVKPGGMWHSVHVMPVWTEFANVFSSGSIALHDVQYDSLSMAATGNTRMTRHIAAIVRATTHVNHVDRYHGRGTGWWR